MHYEGNYSSWLKLLAQSLGKTKEVVAWEHHLNGGQARRQLQHQKMIRKHWKLCYSQNMTEAYNLIPARLK